MTAPADAESVITYWHTAPQEFVREWLLTHAALLPLAWLLSGAVWRIAVAGRPPRVSSADVWSGKVTDPKRVGAASPTASRRGRPRTLLDRVLDAVEGVCIALLPVVLLALVYHKGTTGRIAYFFQPCHLQSITLLLLATVARGPSGAGAKLFQLYLATIYGPVLAMVAPDLREQHGFMEIPLFWAEHVVLVLLPVLWILRRKYDTFAVRWSACAPRRPPV